MSPNYTTKDLREALERAMPATDLACVWAITRWLKRGEEIPGGSTRWWLTRPHGYRGRALFDRMVIDIGQTTALGMQFREVRVRSDPMKIRVGWLGLLAEVVSDMPTQRTVQAPGGLHHNFGRSFVIGCMEPVTFESGTVLAMMSEAVDEGRLFESQPNTMQSVVLDYGMPRVVFDPASAQSWRVREYQTAQDTLRHLLRVWKTIEPSAADEGFMLWMLRQAHAFNVPARVLAVRCDTLRRELEAKAARLHVTGEPEVQA